MKYLKIIKIKKLNRLPYSALIRINISDYCNAAILAVNSSTLA